MAITGSCHCGKTTFRLDTDIPAQLTRSLARSAPNEGRCCIHCGCATFSDSPAFEPDGKWDGSTRRIGVNARLFDDFDAALASIVVIDGKHLWQPWQEG